jgi:hypothetical protein
MDLLFAHGDDGSPILGRDADAATAAGAATRVQPPSPKGFLADITADANDLERQRWGVVAAEGAQGDRLVALVRELAELRAGEQGEEVLEIRVPPGLSTDAASEWKQRDYPEQYRRNERRRPRYLLILGDLDGVSLETQQVLARDGLPGRLAFTDDDGYAAYVAKVLASQREPSQREPPRHDRARALFYTVHDGTSATTAGHAKLIQPCHEQCALTARETPREFPASAVELRGADTPDPDELRALAAARHPSVLLSMSHGMGPPRRRPWSPAEAREHQGAMSFGAEGALGSRDLASAPFLPGGLWIYFACFGAGTPRISAYHHWLEMLAQHGMAELGPVSAVLSGLARDGGFVSGPVRAALANPQGPLAVLGHFDLAWSYSYEELRVGADQRITGTNRSQNFFQLMSKLVAGERAGAAMLALKLPQTDVGARLNDHYDRCKRAGAAEGATPADLLALGNLWMLHQDLQGYALLGDPAVRLPLASRGAAVRGGRAAITTPAAPVAPAAPAPPADAGAVKILEEAVLALARGESPTPIAERLGMTRIDLKEAAEAYHEAGRKALTALLARRAQEKGRDR